MRWRKWPDQYMLSARWVIGRRQQMPCLTCLLVVVKDLIFDRMVFELLMIVAHIRISFAFSQCGREAPNWLTVGCSNLDSAAKSRRP
eukprot:COSAG02_NODE_18052_length_964_cov_1.098266_2_plen_87_part_00